MSSTTKTIALFAATALGLGACAKNYAAMPTALETQQVKFIQGVPTTFSDKPKGAVQVTPLGYVQEDNRFVIGTAAFNKAGSPANFSLDNVAITSGGTPLRTYTRDELAHEAKVKAIWAGVAVALAGAAAAYAANENAYRTTNGYVASPGGITTFSATTYDPATAAIGTAAAGAATGYGLASISNSLDNTITHLNGSILQINTVDPGNSAGGQVVFDMPKAKEFPQPLQLSVTWNGEVHNFAFTLAETKK